MGLIVLRMGIKFNLIYNGLNEDGKLWFKVAISLAYTCFLRFDEVVKLKTKSITLCVDSEKLLFLESLVLMSQKISLFTTIM